MRDKAKTLRQIDALRREQIRRLTEYGIRTPLLDWVPKVTPRMEPPTWLSPIVDRLELTAHEPVHAVISTPPQHGKSSLFFHWIARELLTRPREILYLTYSHDFASTQMHSARPIAERAGIRFENDRLTEWYTHGGGKLTATGIGGRVTGQPAKLIIIDDPVKDWADAQSSTIREYVDMWLRSSVLTRAHPDTSVILVMTRWHPDDLAGRLEGEGWDVVNLPAVSPDGAALWPAGRPIEFLERQRELVGPFVFESLYQGRPRAAGAQVFGEATWGSLDTVPDNGTEAFGLDLAYTARTSADRSVIIYGRMNAGKLYVLDHVVKQVEAVEFGKTIKAVTLRSPKADVFWYRSGTERGGEAFLRSIGVNIRGVDATKDKYVRAQRCAAAWNRGDIIVPRDAHWAPGLVSAVQNFTGVDDSRDDDVDALVGLYEALAGSAVIDDKRYEPPRRGMVSRAKGYY